MPSLVFRIPAIVASTLTLSDGHRIANRTTTSTAPVRVDYVDSRAQTSPSSDASSLVTLDDSSQSSRDELLTHHARPVLTLKTRCSFDDVSTRSRARSLTPRPPDMPGHYVPSPIDSISDVCGRAAAVPAGSLHLEHVTRGAAQETGEVVRDTTERTQYAPALVLTPPDELSPVQEMSPIAGWVEDDRFEPTPVAGRPPRSPNQAQVLSPSLGTAMSDLTSAGGSKGDLETDGDGDGEALEDPLGRPRTPAQMMAERQSREKVVLGTRGASIRELNSGSRQQRRERQARQNASTPRPHAEKEAELGQADVASATEWDESRSKTPKAFALDNKRGASTPDSARRIASEVAPSTPSTANAASSKVGPSASPITTPTPLDAPSPRRATRLNFFGRKGRTQEGSAGSLLASVAGSSGTNSGHGSAVNTDDEEVMASTSDVGSVATPQTAQMPHSAASGLFSPRTPGTANSLNRAPSGSSSAGFWRIGRGMRRDDSASSAVVGTGKKWGVSTPNRVPEASSIPVPETPKTPSIITSDVSFDDAASIASRASRPRPLSAAGSFDGAAAQSSWGRKGRKERGAVPAIDGPRLQKVRSRNKPSKQRDFGRMMLVQELNLGASSITSPPGSRRNSDVGGRPEPSRQSTDNSSLGRRSLGPVGKPPMQHSDSMTSMSSIGASVQSHATTASSTAQSNAAATSRKRATWAMKFSLDGKYLAIAGQDTVVRVYAVLDTPEARTKEIADARARAAAMLNGQATSTNAGLCPFDGKLGAASASTTSLGTANGGGASRPGSLRTRPSLNFNTPGGNNGVPDLPVFSSEPVREFRGHTNDVLDLSWSKGGFLLSASMDKTARLWHLSTPNPLVSFVHGDFVTSACFHPKDDRFFLSGSLDGKLRLWNIPLKRVQCSQEVPGLITACAFTHSGATACVGTFAGAALFYNTDGLTYSSSIAVRSPSGKNARGGRKITGIEPIASDGASGERVLITSNDSRIRAYNLRDKSMSARWKANKTYSNRTSQIRASVADDGTFVVAGSEAGAEGGLVHVWDVGAQAGDSRSPVPGTPLSIKSPKSATTSLAPSADSVCEYWTAGAGTVTCALMAPLKTNALLVCAEDPIASDAARRKADPTSFAAAPFSAGLFGLTSPNTVSSVVGQSHVSPNHDRHCRIIASVDESAVVRIWRSDTHNVIRC
ncbi:WD40 repeat-like protein [Ceraceosorus guamensis]|uniref:WD40 repeat-like protein n=1 Tax=Ceraceosorus guamensis TaxID=1522189 RepID=A0A316VR92_9BASI|nr:WD40 repeat-like protein [Ceraceosorus guamensis]PWN39568.1 WD40 repeat-like protein [Ceraceosorus guamensis]